MEEKEKINEPGKKPLTLKQRAQQLMDKLHNYEQVGEIMNKSPGLIFKLLQKPRENPYKIYTDVVLARMYKENNSIAELHKKTRISIPNIISALQRKCGYKTFDERNGKIKYSDIKKQAAFIKDRDKLIARLFKNGWSVYGLTLEFGLSNPYLLKILKAAGMNIEEKKVYISKKSHDWKKLRDENVYNDFKNGKTVIELSEKYKLGIPAIKYIVSVYQKK